VNLYNYEILHFQNKHLRISKGDAPEKRRQSLMEDLDQLDENNDYSRNELQDPPLNMDGSLPKSEYGWCG
jgi:hypothetical protein